MTRKNDIYKDIIEKYYDTSAKKLKIARNFSVQYFNNCVPKNAVHGKATNNLYVYVDDFDQFNPEHKYTRFTIWILDKRSKGGRFQKTIVKKHTSWYYMIFAFIAYHDLFDVKCIPVNCMKRANVVPGRKEPQTKTGYMYKSGVYSQNCVDPYCYECIDTDVTRTRFTYYK